MKKVSKILLGLGLSIIGVLLFVFAIMLLTFTVMHNPKAAEQAPNLLAFAGAGTGTAGGLLAIYGIGMITEQVKPTSS